MKSWSPRLILAVLLTNLLIVSTVTSSIQAAGMAAGMVMAPDSIFLHEDDCWNCPGMDDDGGAMVACQPACMAVISALLPPVPSLSAMPASHPHALAQARLHGRTARLEPDPPRFSAFS